MGAGRSGVKVTYRHTTRSCVVPSICIAYTSHLQAIYAQLPAFLSSVLEKFKDWDRRSHNSPPEGGTTPPATHTSGPKDVSTLYTTLTQLTLACYLHVCGRCFPWHALHQSAPVPLGLGPGRDASSRRRSSYPKRACRMNIYVTPITYT